ncbi:MAG: hypothetical protein V7K67_26740 [Nostoc sp.]
MKQVSKALNERITGNWGLGTGIFTQHGLNAPLSMYSTQHFQARE